MSPPGRSGTRLACIGRASAQLARLLGSTGGQWEEACLPGSGTGRINTVVKKLLVVVLLGLSVFAVWRKVQADRAELDLWTEATTADD
jgi:hypothetical protein